MGWSYRVVKDNFKLGDDDALGVSCRDEWKKVEYTFFNIHEVHYDQREAFQGGASCCCPIRSVSVDPIKPHGSTVKELKWDLELMLLAFERPVLIQQEIDHLFTEPEPEPNDGES